jgi:DnaJ family protein C protein 2
MTAGSNKTPNTSAASITRAGDKQQVQIISSLNWPSSPQRITIQCVGTSFLEYHYLRHEQTKANILAFVKSQTAGTNENDTCKASPTTSTITSDNNEKRVQQRNLFDFSEEELSKMSYYDVLHVPMFVDSDGLKRAYHKACLRYHPDKSGRGEDDYVFLAVKAAFDTLSDTDKRRSYDSSVDFDDSIPSGGEVSPEEFYTTYGPVFERNLRFAVRNENNNSSSSGGANNRGNRASKGSSSHNNKGTVTALGDDTTPIDQVNAFYEYWTHFESWRDFTLKAQELTKHDLDAADNRDEKRWMAKEVDRKAKALKKQEVARIALLVERAMAADPRLKRFREQDRLMKERIREERQAKHRQKEQEIRERQEQERKLQEAREEEERLQKAKEKVEKEKQKKELRKSRQLLRKLSINAYERSNSSELWENLEQLNDDVEMLCDKLSLEHLVSLTVSLQSRATATVTTASEIPSEDAIEILEQHIRNVKGMAEKDNLAQIQKREEIRRLAAEKDAAEKAASAMKPWSKTELSYLAKAVKKFPAGGANRWESISYFINNTLSLSEPRTKEECIAQYNQTLRNVVATTAAAAATPTTERSSSNVDSTTPTSPSSAALNGVGSASTTSPVVEGDTWTVEQDTLLQEGLKKFPSTMDKNERWTNIAKGVPGKSKKDCVQRFKIIREALLNSKKK